MSSNSEVNPELTAASALAGLAKEDESGDEFRIPQRFTKSGRKRAVPFTMKLMKVLSDKKNADIITWMPSGKSFNILKPKAFVADILPKHFKTAKYSSFTRKLHRWGFMRHYRGEEAGAFYHKDFQRGRLDLVEQMTCHKVEPPKSAAATTQAAAAENKAPAKPAPLRAPAALPNPPPARAVAAPTAPPVTPKTIKMQVLSVPTSLTSTSARTPILNTPSMSVNVSASLPPMAPQLTATSTMGSTTDRLNAAIELEVNRRIKERINAAALQRHAFAVSALRQQQLMNNHSQQQQVAALLLQKQAGLFQNTTSIPTGAPALGYRALASEGETLSGAPPTNIQGARTA